MYSFSIIQYAQGNGNSKSESSPLISRLGDEKEHSKALKLVPIFWWRRGLRTYHISKALKQVSFGRSCCQRLRTYHISKALKHAEVYHEEDKGLRTYHISKALKRMNSEERHRACLRTYHISKALKRLQS